MVAYCLKLGQVYSRLAAEEDLAKLEALTGVSSASLPPTYRLRKHQLDTWLTYNDPAVDVIFDTALTGDGKSLAGQLPLLTQNQRGMFLYPTNELIKDQAKGFARNWQDFDMVGKKRDYAIMNSEKITDLVIERELATRRNAIESLMANDALLSNPDLFHLLSSYHYGGNPDKMQFAFRLPNEYKYFVFDEFHIFEPPQIMAVLNILNYHKAVYPNEHHKYIFLSATPTPLFQKLLDNSGFRWKNVAGDYSPVGGPGFTIEPIVQPVSLDLHKLSDKGAYQWAVDNLDRLVEFYRQNPGSKGVFIVNSVATVKRLIAFYKVNLEKAHNIEVGENTGLTRRSEAAYAMDKDSPVQLIVATSTVDVGVDFEINLLIFEATGAGTFIQRLGRLGRHQREGWKLFQAHALLPEWIVDKFAARFPADGQEIERTEFLEAVRGSQGLTTGPDVIAEAGAIFQAEQEYRHYVNRWAGLQTAHVLIEAQQGGTQNPENSRGYYKNKDELSQKLYAQYNRLYGGNEDKDRLGRCITKYERMRKDSKLSPILKELNRFRGGSPLACGILDETDGGFPKTYDLLFLLANTRFTCIDEAEFRAAVERHPETRGKFERFKSQQLGLYVRLHEYQEERDNFSLTLRRSLKGKLNMVSVLNNFNIADSKVLAGHDNNRVNDQLAPLELVVLAVAGTPKEFKRKRYLGPLFPVYAVKDKDGLAPRSVMFGLNALLAYSQIPYKELGQDGADADCLIF